MLDEEDQGTRIGVTVALCLALLVAIGLSLWMAIRGPGGGTAAAAAPVTEVIVVEEVFVDVPLSGALAGTLYFAVGKAELPADAAAAIGAIKAAAGADKKLLISGFTDATGDPAVNAELAKNRAKAVRAALQAEGIAPARTLLRRPESSTGDGSNREARRVEVHVAD